MNSPRKSLFTLAIAAVACAAALAQPTSDDVVVGGQPAPELQVQRGAGGVNYVQGGAGEEARDALQRAQPAFSVRNEFSGAGGAYVVPDKVTVNSERGQVLSLEKVGPVLMLDLPPGHYTMEAQYAGEVQTKSVDVAERDLRTLNWHWDGRAGR